MELASNNLVLTQTAIVNTILHQKARNAFQPEQLINLNRVVTVSVSNTLSMLQVFHKIGTANSVLAFNQTAIIKFSLLQTDNSISLTGVTTCQRIRSASSFNILVLQTTAIGHGVFSQNVSNTLTFSQELAKDFQRITQSIIFTQSTTGTISKQVNASNNLLIQQSINTQNIFNKIAVNVLNLMNGFIYHTQMSSKTVIIPPATVIIVKRLTLLRVANSVIVLPTAKLADTLNFDGSILIKRSINGILYTSIKRSDLFKLKYVWTLDRKKALELKAFIINNFHDSIIMTNWKGEVWNVNIINSPVEMFAKSIGERIDVAIEFEGIKLSG